MPNEENKYLTYTIFPMRESLVKSLIFWIVVVFTIWGVWLNVGSLLLTIIAGAILILSLSSFYLPTIYRIDSNGVMWKRLTGSRSIQWQRVRRVSDERDGMFLSPFAGRTMMENFRGIYLPYRSNHDEISALVKLYVPEKTGSKPSTGDPLKTSVTPAVRNYFGHRR